MAQGDMVDGEQTMPPSLYPKRLSSFVARLTLSTFSEISNFFGEAILVEKTLT